MYVYRSELAKQLLGLRAGGRFAPQHRVQDRQYWLQCRVLSERDGVCERESCQREIVCVYGVLSERESVFV